MRVVAEANETLPTLGRICQGKNGVKELGLKLGILSLRVEFAIICATNKCIKQICTPEYVQCLLLLARYGRGQCKMI
jgi:hypothetical protein